MVDLSDTACQEKAALWADVQRLSEHAFDTGVALPRRVRRWLERVNPDPQANAAVDLRELVDALRRTSR